MNLDEPITLSEGDKKINLPLKNLLRLAMVYLRPFIDGYLSELAKQDIKIYNVYRTTWDNIYKEIMAKLGAGTGKQVLL